MTPAGPPSGQQFELSHGPHTATVVEVGGGVRRYRYGERDVLQPYPVDAMCDGAHGTPLIPWPNRLGDGRYRFDGVDHQVALTEPDQHNAIHGFLRWRSWTATDRDVDRVTMTTELHPLQGYPFHLSIAVIYELSDDGLRVTTVATNRGDRIAPYGSGQHPYLSPGEHLLDDCILTLADRQLPTGTQPVAGTPYDFASPRQIGDLAIDYAFTDLTRDDSGRASVHLTAPDGYTASTWVDDAYPIIELYTADTLTPDRRRRGLGTEPMTMPPNGLQTGDGVIQLQPGHSHTGRWGATITVPQ